MPQPEWKLVRHDLAQYPSGLRAGDQVRVKRDIVIHDSTGQPTEDVHRVGEIWTVDIGVASEPGTIWFLQADGGRHTWDYDESFHETFDILPRELA